MSSEGSIGKHVTYVEEPDIIFLRLDGPVSAEEGSEIIRLHDYQVMKELPVRGVVLYQAPLRARVIAKLILTTMNMFRSEAEKVPVHFVDTEEEARDWLAKRREEVAPRRAETVGAERS